MSVKDCNSCHYASWSVYEPSIGECSAPLPKCTDGFRYVIQSNWADCPAYKPRVPWLPKKKLDI